MKKLISITWMFLFSLSVVKAQPGGMRSDDAEKVKTRKLIVVTEVPDEKVVKDITKRKETATLEQYKSTLESYNQKMKAVAEKYWPYASNGIEYKTWAETVQLKKGKNKDYAVLYCYLRSQSMVASAGFKQTYRDDGMNQAAYLIADDHNKGYQWHNTQMEVTLVEDFGRNSPVCGVRVPDICPTELSMIFGIKTITMMMNIQTAGSKSEAKKAAMDWETSRKNCRKMDVAKLKDKTLMIRKDLLDKDVTEAILKENYPYAYKLCTKEELDEMCINDKVPANTAVLLDFPVDDEAFEPKAAHANIYVYDLNNYLGLTVVAENFVKVNEKSLKNFTKK